MSGTLEPPCVTPGEIGTAWPACNPTMSRFRPRIAGPLIRRSKMEQGCTSIHTHEEWSQRSAIGSGFQNFVKSYYQSPKEKKHRRGKRGKMQKRDSCWWVLRLRVGQWHSIAWLLSLWLVHTRSCLEFWRQCLADSWCLCLFCSSEIC